MTTVNEDYKTKYTDEELSQKDQGPIQEEFPFLSRRVELDSEEQINQNRRHNAWIIIGRDRPAGLKSGYGQFPVNKKNRLIDGRKSSTIDIGVGRYSGANQTLNRDETVGNHIQYDAARIYISQKTDIDNNFLINKAGTLENAVAQSAIGLKADVLRLAARENIKLVANTGDPSNSTGIRNRSVNNLYGIQLITGIGDNAIGANVQGIVKAENLKNMLEALLNQISEFVGFVGSYIQLQDEFNKSILEHTHEGIVRASPNGSIIAFQSVDIMTSHAKYISQKISQIDSGIVNLKINFGGDLKAKYLNETANPKNYIGSIYNKTN